MPCPAKTASESAKISIKNPQRKIGPANFKAKMWFEKRSGERRYGSGTFPAQYA